jgi:hypothetical protein
MDGSSSTIRSRGRDFDRMTMNMTAGGAGGAESCHAMVSAVRPSLNMGYSAGMRTRLAIAAWITVLLSSPGTRAARFQGTTAGEAKNDAVVATTSAVLGEMSTLRELPTIRPVKSGTQSRQAIEGMIVKNLNEQTTPAQMHASEVTLKKLGMVPPDFQIRPFIIALLTEQVAGYYDPQVREFYLADWIDLNGQKPVMAHELTHALQDQHFNLQRLSKWPHGDSDAELAAHALVEGDATLAMTYYAIAHPETLSALMASAAGASDQITRAPRSLREGLAFPFEKGLMWTMQLQQLGGWSAVSAAFGKLHCWAAAGRESTRTFRVSGAITPCSMNSSRNLTPQRRPQRDGAATAMRPMRGPPPPMCASSRFLPGTPPLMRANSPTRMPGDPQCGTRRLRLPSARRPGTRVKGMW